MDLADLIKSMYEEVMGHEEFESLIGNLIASGSENSYTEFKKDWWDPDVVGEYISALSNGAAQADLEKAYIIWGIDDRTKQVVGSSLEINSKKRNGSDYSIWVTKHLSPSLGELSWSVGEYKSKRCVIMRIPAAKGQPTKYMNTAFIRLASNKVPLDKFSEVEAELWRKLTQLPFETAPAKEKLTINDILRLLSVKTYYELQEKTYRVDNLEKIRDDLLQDKVITKQDSGTFSITNMGALLFAEDLNEFEHLRRKAVRIVKYRGGNKVDALSEEILDSGYAVDFGSGVTAIMSQIGSIEKISRDTRKTIREYPDVVIRELLANMMIHQDLSVTGAGPLVEIYSDRIDFSNPGAPLVPPDRIIDSPPISRNEQLANLMRRCHLCEERGSGWDRIAQQVGEYRFPAPEINVTPPSVAGTSSHMDVALLPQKSPKDMTQEERINTTYIHACYLYSGRGRLNNAELRSRFGLSNTRAHTVAVSNYLKEAIEANKIKVYDETVGDKGKSYVPYWA